MRKYLFNILFAVAGIIALVSCESEITPAGDSAEGGIRLEFVCNDHGTKAVTKPGEDDYNENTLTTIDYFLYPEGEMDSDAYIKGRVELQGRTSYNVLVNTTQLNRLFSGAAAGSHCDVYAIANYPGSVTDFDAASDTTTLHNLAVSKHFNASTVQTNFVMSGYAQATVINKNKTKAAEGTVKLNRAASKISFECRLVDHVDIKNYIYSEGVKIDSTITTWVPLVEQMGVYLVNSFSDGTVGGTPAAMDEGALDRYSQRTLTDDDNDDWYTCNPFYSYPQSWNSGDEREPFLKLVVPWAYLNSAGVMAGQKQFYYKVPCPGLKMDANTWYHIKLDVAILGGDDFEAMLEIQGEYYVLEWNTQTIVETDAEVKDARYISVPSNTYEMFNVPDLDVLITSSNDAEMVLKSVTYYNFATGANQNLTSTAQSNNWITYDDEARTFSIRHTLNNDISTTTFDSSPYIFTFEIRHADDHNYTTGDIVVTQYPAMYINELQSNKYAFLNGTGNQANSQVTGQDDSGNSLSTLPTRNSINDSGANTNSHMYRISVTSVTGLDYTIGDTRLWSDSQNVTTLNSLSNYMEAAAINEDMIAPEFMVASSVGKTQALSYKYAATRCAAYQESGFPAGRWRLPTKAEIFFLINLSEKDKIPELFTAGALNTGGYWCSSGVVYPLPNGTVEYYNFDDAERVSGRTTNFPRCIYDTWYWGQNPDSAHLTSWGGYQTTP